MTNPTLGGTTLPCPTDSKIDPVWVYADNTTIGGKTRRDVMARKYKYTLHWEFMDATYYTALQTKVNILTAQTFIYDKYTESGGAGVSVLSQLSARVPKTPGLATYYSEVSLTMIETESRI